MPNVKHLLFIISLLLFWSTTGTLSQDLTCSFTFLYVEPLTSPAPPESGQESVEIIGPVEPYILQVKEGNTSTVGLILSHNATVTMYTDDSRIMEIYTVRPEASERGYRYLDAQQPVAASAVQIDTNLYYPGFNEVMDKASGIGCDATRLRASRSLNILGGSYLAAYENAQDRQVTRRAELRESYYTHEMIVLRSVTDEDVAPTISGVSLLRFELPDVLALQVVSFSGKDAPQISLPSIQDTTNYTLVSNRAVQVNVFVIRAEGLIPTPDGKSTVAREQFLLIREEVNETDFYIRLRDAAFFIPPLNVAQAVYLPGQVLELDIFPLSDAELDRQQFVCSEVLVPYTEEEGYTADVFQYNLNDGLRFADTVRPEDGDVDVIGVDENTGYLRVTTVSGDVFIDHWLVECPSSDN